MTKLKKSLKTYIVSLLVTFSTGNTHAGEGVLLNCDRNDGADKFQIYINETKEYVLYNAQLRDSYERKGEYSVRDSLANENQEKTMVIDVGLDIRENNSNFIIARDDNATFVFVKKTMSYAYAWAVPLPVTKDHFLAFGNNHSGNCSVNPFKQSE